MKRIRYMISTLLLVCVLVCSCEVAADRNGEGEKTTYTVTLDYDYLGQVETQTVPKGELVEPPSHTPGKVGFENLGWFVQENGQWRQWDFTVDVVTEDLTLKILREEQVSVYSYALVYNDGTDRVEISQVKYGTNDTLPVPTWEGHTFLGWDTDHDMTVIAENGETVNTVYLALWSDVSPDTKVFFGEYQQDGDAQNGKEPIELLVVDKSEDGSAYFLVSRYLLEWMPFHSGDDYTAMAWEKRELRTWLNGVFYNGAFDDEARAHIRLTYLEDVGTSDRVFLLSLEELRFLASNEYRVGMMTDSTAKKEDVHPAEDRGQLDSYKSYGYWVRYAKDYNSYEITTSGSNYHAVMGKSYAGVRPAMWVDAEYVDALINK